MYIFCGLIFSILALVSTYVLFDNPTNKQNITDLGIFIIITILFYLVAIISFGIESICDKLDRY
jgi:hypothetical protein